MTDTEEATVDELAKLYDRHERRTTRVQRLANRLTTTLGRPTSLVVIFGLAIAWIIGNYVARSLGSTALEEFPFPDLGFIATIAALLVALLILTTQRHEEELAESRAQLTLHIAMLSERKIAKIISFWRSNGGIIRYCLLDRIEKRRIWLLHRTTLRRSD